VIITIENFTFLALRDEQLGYGSLPEAYAKIKIIPKMLVVYNS
jgi:hypothetical protein